MNQRSRFQRLTPKQLRRQKRTHGFFNQTVSGGKWFNETLLEVDRFLTNLKFLPAPPPAQGKQ